MVGWSGHSKSNRDCVPTSSPPALPSDRAKQRAQDRLVEKLSLLCATQSRAGPGHADTAQDTKQQEAGSRWDFLPAMALSSVDQAHGFAAFIRPVGEALDVLFLISSQESVQVDAMIVSIL